MVPNSFLIILFSIIIFPLTFTQDTSSDDYYNGNGVTNSNNGNSGEINDCLCDIKPGECDFHCCCDNNCPNEAIEDWEKHSNCINEQNSQKLSNDKCIDKNLFPSWYDSSKEYPRRGLHLENQTEDIPKKSGTIYNLCFSIDNSKSKDIIGLEDLEKYGYKNIEKMYDDIFDDYIEPFIINNNNDNTVSNDRTTSTLRRTNNDENEKSLGGINIENNYNKFAVDGKFSLFSGTNCENTNIVEIWNPKNYSCLMKKDEALNYNYFNNIKINNQFCDSSDGRYYIDENGLLSKKGGEGENLIVLQVEFILKINSTNSEIDNCKINIVEYNKNDENDFIFKNSVIFTNEIEKIAQYRYSGNIGYLNGYPLKIYFQDKVYNDFYIVGSEINGDCRTNGNILDYLYFSDKPLLFNEDYTYSCKLNSISTSLNNTILYKKIMNITKVAKYGSSDYRNVDNEDWIIVNKKVNESILNEKNKSFIIQMNIRFKTDKKKGFYSHKYINEVSIGVNEVNEKVCDNNNNENNCNVKLEIKYFGDDETNESKYKKKPNRPFFIPKIPDDILDPFINPDVDK